MNADFFRVTDWALKFDWPLPRSLRRQDRVASRTGTKGAKSLRRSAITLPSGEGWGSGLCPLSSGLCPLVSVLCPLSSGLCPLSSVPCPLVSGLWPLTWVLLFLTAESAENAEAGGSGADVVFGGQRSVVSVRC